MSFFVLVHFVQSEQDDAILALWIRAKSHNMLKNLAGGMFLHPDSSKSLCMGGLWKYCTF